ncbi:hypothetical protein HDV05_007120 [Chytridiales sp. JEL 0842]|nr:hypothetical protein HDV05_007120 [Chytridiales sp. JEL 0842]
MYPTSPSPPHQPRVRHGTQISLVERLEKIVQDSPFLLDSPQAYSDPEEEQDFSQRKERWRRRTEGGGAGAGAAAAKGVRFARCGGGGGGGGVIPMSPEPQVVERDKEQQQQQGTLKVEVKKKVDGLGRSASLSVRPNLSSSMKSITGGDSAEWNGSLKARQRRVSMHPDTFVKEAGEGRRVRQGSAQSLGDVRTVNQNEETCINLQQQQQQRQPTFTVPPNRIQQQHLQQPIVPLATIQQQQPPTTTLTTLYSSSSSRLHRRRPKPPPPVQPPQPHSTLHFPSSSLDSPPLESLKTKKPAGGNGWGLGSSGAFLWSAAKTLAGAVLGMSDPRYDTDDDDDEEKKDVEDNRSSYTSHQKYYKNSTGAVVVDSKSRLHQRASTTTQIPPAAEHPTHYQNSRPSLANFESGRLSGGHKVAVKPAGGWGTWSKGTMWRKKNGRAGEDMV